jgi:hypothetical protein
MYFNKSSDDSSAKYFNQSSDDSSAMYFNQLSDHSAAMYFMNLPDILLLFTLTSCLLTLLPCNFRQSFWTRIGRLLLRSCEDEGGSSTHLLDKKKTVFVP